MSIEYYILYKYHKCPIFRIEKDKSQIMIEIQDVRAATDEVGRSKVNLRMFEKKS